MKNRKFIAIIQYTIIIMQFTLFSGCKTKDKEAKHVILISMDTTRADHLSCYGFDKKTTPNIDKFAKDSVLFEQCISPVPFTLPAHSSMLTGTNPVYHGVHENVSYTLAPENTTLAEMFQEKGYETGAIVSTFVLDPQFGLDQGFDFYDGSFENPIEKGFIAAITERRGDAASLVAMEWLEKNKDEDFFLFLHYYDPHFQYNPPQPFAGQFKDDLYAGEIAYTDFCIKQVFDKLKALKIYDDALIILVGDHGEGLKEHGEQEHGYYIYQSSIHVPMIVHFPGGKYRNRRVTHTTGLIDIAPTVARWMGLDPLPEYVGQDLTAYVEKKPLDERFILSESLRATQYGASSLLSLVSGRWKYIQSSDPEMYDLKKDPAESRNLIEPEAKRSRLFQEELKLMLTEQVRKTASRSGKGLDAESRRKLESLGYLAGGTVEEDFTFDTDKDHPRDWFDVYQDLTSYFIAKQQGEFAKAQEYCLRIQKDKPFYVMNYMFLAELQFNLGKYAEAIRTANDFLVRAQEKLDGKSKDRSIDPVEASLGPVHHIIGMCYFRMGQGEKAVEELNIALKLSDEADTDKIYNNFGNIYLSQGKIDLALEHFSKAVQVNPDFHEGYYNLGLVYTHQKAFEKALQSFSKAYELKPDWDQPKQKAEQTQQVIAMKETLESTIQKLKSELQKDPRDTAVLDKLGGCCQLLGQIAEAIDYWNQSLAIQPANPTVLNNLAYLYSQKENVLHLDADKAMGYAEKANKLTGYQNPNYLDTLASVYASKGDFDRALEIAQQALELAQSQNDPALVQSIQKSIDQYQKRFLP
jgi:arylsulfatase A-like enzyme/tetratricopeptide (TPR) repeat protein